jgi:hypothetical protein
MHKTSASRPSGFADHSQVVAQRRGIFKTHVSGGSANSSRLAAIYMAGGLFVTDTDLQEYASAARRLFEDIIKSVNCTAMITSHTNLRRGCGGSQSSSIQSSDTWRLAQADCPRVNPFYPLLVGVSPHTEIA